MKTIQKLKHLKKHFGFKDEQLIEIKKMYDGEFFDPADANVQKLYKISQDICNQYNNILRNTTKKQSLFKNFQTMLKKTKLLSLLFIKHGLFGDIREVNAIVGLVDLGRYVFLNRDAMFSKYALVSIDHRTLFGVNVKVGSDTPKQDGQKICLEQICIGKDCWLGAGAKIENNVTLEPRVVVAGGAVVTECAPCDTLLLGRPAKVYAHLDENYHTKPKSKPNYTDKQKEKIFAVLKNLGYDNIQKDYTKILSGEKFNTAKPKVGSLFLLTHRLCAKLSHPSTTPERKNEIVDILFPNHGKNFKIGDGVFLDVLGTVIVGDNVSIGNNVYLAGNVFIGDNVKIEDGVTIFGSEHDLIGKKRKHALSRATWTDTICVENNVTLGQDCVIAPNSTVDRDVPAKALFTNKKTIA